jgi:hypothetical protein
MHDLFQGSYGGGCIALDGVNSKGIVEALQHTVVQMAEIKDKATNETKGYIRCYMAENLDNPGQPMLVVDNIHYIDEYKGDDLIMLDAARQFADGYAKVVTRSQKPVPTYIGECCHLLESDESTENFSRSYKFQVAGDTETHNYYFNSIDDGDWTEDIHEPQYAELYPLSEFKLSS